MAHSKIATLQAKIASLTTAIAKAEAEAATPVAPVKRGRPAKVARIATMAEAIVVDLATAQRIELADRGASKAGRPRVEIKATWKNGDRAFLQVYGAELADVDSHAKSIALLMEQTTRGIANRKGQDLGGGVTGYGAFYYAK